MNHRNEALSPAPRDARVERIGHDPDRLQSMPDRRKEAVGKAEEMIAVLNDRLRRNPQRR